jgi:uncharacterized protein (DUF2249 family)
MTLAEALARSAYLEERPRTSIRGLYLTNRETARLLVVAAGESSVRKVLKPLTPHNERFAIYFERLDSLADGSSESERPSSLSVHRARTVLQKLESENIEPIKITLAAEGGVAICFANREIYSDIECLDSGEILGVISNRRDHPTVWEIEPSEAGIASAVARIRAFLTSAKPHDATGTPRR